MKTPASQFSMAHSLFSTLSASEVRFIAEQGNQAWLGKPDLNSITCVYVHFIFTKESL